MRGKFKKDTMEKRGERGKKDKKGERLRGVERD